MPPSTDKTAADLSWLALLERLGRGCYNDQAAEALLHVSPLADRATAQEQNDVVREAMELVARSESLPMRRFPPLGDVVEALLHGGIANGKQLRDAAQMLRVALELHRHAKKHEGLAPTLARRLATDPELFGLLPAFDRALDDAGELRDAASPALASARQRLGQARRELRDRQQQLLGKYAESLSGQFFAEREGRWVLPVRSDAPQRVEGWVVGASGSGSTLYTEPRELIDASNRVKIEESRVLEEEEKILRALSSELLTRLPAVERANAVCLEADGLRSIALWGHAVDAHPVTFSDALRLELHAFRHPLLLDDGGGVVANDLTLSGGQCLILSGPNAGGKTVAMKCLGLAVYMARSGLPLPCKPDSVVGWFDAVITDIGDEQSLARSLSTFSAHVTHVAGAIARARAGTLVLLDELASGTDPDEGAALAEAVLHALVERGAAVCTTTHYERLKRLGASGDPHFCNAAVGFDVERLAPTFRLSPGIVGMSAAFAVAERYGIPKDVVELARASLPKERQEQQRVIEQLEQERQRVAVARETSEADARAAAQLLDQARRERDRAFEREQARLQRESSELMQEVTRARSLLQRARAILAGETPTKEQLKEVEALIGEAASPVVLDGPLAQALERDPGVVPALDQLVPGHTVYVPHLKARGEVVDAPKKGSVRVLIGGLRLVVPVAKLREVTGSNGKRPAPELRGQRRTKTTHTEHPSAAAAVRTTDNTCDLRGVRVEAGLEEIDRFIDRLLRSGEPAGFVLHGHGTGAMKAAAREHLGTSAYVAHFEPASKEDGGDALTLFWLRG